MCRGHLNRTELRGRGERRFRLAQKKIRLETHQMSLYQSIVGSYHNITIRSFDSLVYLDQMLFSKLTSDIGTWFCWGYSNLGAKKEEGAQLVQELPDDDAVWQKFTKRSHADDESRTFSAYIRPWEGRRVTGKEQALKHQQSCVVGRLGPILGWSLLCRFPSFVFWPVHTAPPPLPPSCPGQCRIPIPLGGWEGHGGGSLCVSPPQPTALHYWSRGCGVVVAGGSDLYKGVGVATAHRFGHMEPHTKRRIGSIQLPS